jgi:hypothetical protein
MTRNDLVLINNALLLEIGVQAARKQPPDLSDDGLLALAKTVQGFPEMVSRGPLSGISGHWNELGKSRPQVIF